jgi:hypothetical protein
MRKPTRQMVRATITIQRFYTHYLARNVTKNGVTCHIISNMDVNKAFDTIRIPAVVQVMKRILLRILVLSERGMVVDDDIKTLRETVNARAFTWAYISAHSPAFITYHNATGDAYSEDVAATAKEMLGVFEGVLRRITDSPMGADHFEAIDKTLDLQQLIRFYGIAFDKWDFQDKKRIVAKYTDKYTNICALEDNFAANNSLTVKVRNSLEAQKAALRIKLNTIKPTGVSALRSLDDARRAQLIAQVAHELVYDPNLDMNQYKTKFCSSQQHKIPNLVLLVAKKGFAYEREYINKIEADGNRCTHQTFKWFLAVFRMLYRYRQEVDVVKQEHAKGRLERIVNTLTEPDMCSIVGISLVVLLTGDVHPVLAQCPETLHFDLPRIIRIHDGFQTQFLVLELTKFLLEIFGDTDKKLDHYNYLTMVTEKIMVGSVGLDEVDKIIDIICTTTSTRFALLQKNSEHLRKLISTRLHIKDNSIGSSKHTLRRIMQIGLDYKNQFRHVAETRAIFKKFDLPISAIGLAPILHTQCAILHKMVKMNTAVHSRRYPKIIQDAAMSVLCEYPLRLRLVVTTG